TERVKTATAPGQRAKSIATSITQVRTVEASAEGFVQEWRWRDSGEKGLEGDKTAAEAMAKAIEELEAQDFALAIELDALGAFRRMRNIDEAGRLFRQAMRPAMFELMKAGVEEGLAGADQAQRQQALDK